MITVFASLSPVFLLLGLGLLLRRREITLQMGGDAPLVATAVTLQTALSFLTIPHLIWPAQSFK